MEIKSVKSARLCDTGAVQDGNRLTESAGSRMAYQPASVTVIKMRVEEGIAQSNPGGGLPGVGDGGDAF